MKFLIHRLLAPGVLALLLICSTSSIFAQSTWNGSTTAWASAGNWSPSGIPTASTNITFSDTGNAIAALGNNGVGNASFVSYTRTVGAGALSIIGGAGAADAPPALNSTFNFDSLTKDASTSVLVLGNQGALDRFAITTFNISGNLTVNSELQLGNALGTVGQNTSSIGHLSVGGNTTINSGGNVTLVRTTGIVNLGDLQINGGVLNLSTGSAGGIGTSLTVENFLTVESLSGATGTIQLNKASTNATLTINGTANGSYGGVIQTGTGTRLSLVKDGNSVQTLSSTNTYTGSTMISEGTLLLDATGSIASTTLGFGVTDTNNGLLTADNAAFSFSGTLTLALNGVTLTENTWTLFDGSGFDATALTITGVTSDIGSLTFADIGAGDWEGTDGSNRTWTFSSDLGTLTVVPEPSTLLLLGAGSLALVFYRRRRADR